MSDMIIKLLIVDCCRVVICNNSNPVTTYLWSVLLIQVCKCNLPVYIISVRRITLVLYGNYRKVNWACYPVAESWHSIACLLTTAIVISPDSYSTKLQWSSAGVKSNLWYKSCLHSAWLECIHCMHTNPIMSFVAYHLTIFALPIYYVASLFKVL